MITVGKYYTLDIEEFKRINMEVRRKDYIDDVERIGEEAANEIAYNSRYYGINEKDIDVFKYNNYLKCGFIKNDSCDKTTNIYFIGQEDKWWYRDETLCCFKEKKYFTQEELEI